MKNPPLKLFAVSTPGIEEITAGELHSLGMSSAHAVPGGVEFQGGPGDLYRANLWLRTASRVLIRLARFRSVHLSELEKSSKALAWDEWLDPRAPIMVRAITHKSKIYHSGAAAERVANGIAGRLKLNTTPDHKGVGLPEDLPGVGIQVRIHRDVCEISLDSSGDHLHRRGYRTHATEAPMRETLASAFLMLAGFDGSRPLLDPMCSSGTFPIEGALIASRRPPGRHRPFAFFKHAGFDSGLWSELLAQADSGVQTPPHPIRGADQDEDALAAALKNAQKADVDQAIEFINCSVGKNTLTDPPGLVICNPPYGVRLGDPRKLRNLYASLGNLVLRSDPAWQLALITSNEPLARATRVAFENTSAPIPHGGLRVKMYTTR